MKTLKKSGMLFLSAAFILTFVMLPVSVNAKGFIDNAEENSNSDYIVVESEPGHLVLQANEDDIEKQIQNSINEIMQNKISTRVPEYTNYEYVYGEKQYPESGAYAGNQPINGDRFPQGGSFIWADNGGPTVSMNVGFSVGMASVGFSFGNAYKTGVSGVTIPVPSTSYNYKLKVYKTMQVQQVAVYGYPIYGGSKKFLYYIYPSALYEREFWCVRMN